MEFKIGDKVRFEKTAGQMIEGEILSIDKVFAKVESSVNSSNRKVTRKVYIKLLEKIE